MIVSASFPSGVWDGLSNNPFRTSRLQNNAGDYRDFDRLEAEIIAVQKHLVSTINTTNTAALATTATTGHSYLPTVAGTPTGVPTARTGYAAVVYDTTAHKIWVYDGSTWKYAAMT